MKHLQELLESLEDNDGKFAPSPSADPPHRRITKNSDQTIFMQIVHPSHHTNNRPETQGWLNSPENKTTFPAVRFIEGGKVVLIGKQTGWEKNAARIQIHYDNINEIIEALQFAKSQLEKDRW